MSATLDITSTINQLLPLVSVVLVLMIVISLMKELKGAF